jgi:hypothetical protein
LYFGARDITVKDMSELTNRNGQHKEWRRIVNPPPAPAVEKTAHPIPTKMLPGDPYIGPDGMPHIAVPETEIGNATREALHQGPKPIHRAP